MTNKQKRLIKLERSLKTALDSLGLIQGYLSRYDEDVKWSIVGNAYDTLDNLLEEIKEIKDDKKTK